MMIYVQVCYVKWPEGIPRGSPFREPSDFRWGNIKSPDIVPCFFSFAIYDSMIICQYERWWPIARLIDTYLIMPVFFSVYTVPPFLLNYTLVQSRFQWVQSVFVAGYIYIYIRNPNFQRWIHNSCGVKSQSLVSNSQIFLPTGWCPPVRYVGL